MPKSLYLKITLAFMLVAMLTALLVVVFIRATTDTRLAQFIIDQQRSNLETALSQYYQVNGSWKGVANHWLQYQFRAAPTDSAPSNPRDDNRLGFEARGNLLGLADASGKVVVSVDPNYPAGSVLPADVLKAGSSVVVNGKQVGTILVAQQPPRFNSQEALFLRRTNQALIFALLGALPVALVIGILLARTLTGPLQALTRAAQRITQGQLDQQVRVTSDDEIGQLARAFNRMSQEVARVNQLRRQMTADIAHDLRTPLTVISGYIESMKEGVLSPTPERLSLIYSEIERLQNLVGDLRMLSLADAGELSLNPQWIVPHALLERAADLFRHQAEQQKVSIRVDANEPLPELWVDEARMMQVLGNLVSNALRYTPSEGTITLSAEKAPEQVEICVQDTGAGISPEDLPYIFDRFHRIDKSRHTENGESGLGLAIVKTLVESHGGSVSAESTPGAGTAVRLLFPIKQHQS